MSNQTYVDPVKQESRVRLKEFIERELIANGRSPNRLKVVCFPGAEVEGQEAIEVKEVYLPLGIPPQNITGLEYDVEKAERLQQAGLGIQVVPASDLEFFTSTRDRFDIVSLDYTGQQGVDETKTLEKLVGRGIIQERGVLCTNYSTRREGLQQKLRLAFHCYRGSGISGFSVTSFDEEYMRSVFEEIFDGSKDVELELIREGITINTAIAFLLGHANIKPSEVVTGYPISDLIDKELSRKFLDEDSEQSELPELRKLNATLRKMGFDEFSIDDEDKRALHFIDIHMEMLGKYLTRMISEEYGFLDDLPEDQQQRAGFNLAKWMYFGERDPYLPTALERYSYTSNKNTTMYMDIFGVRRKKDIRSRIGKVAAYNSRTGLIHLNPTNLNYNQFWRAMRQLDPILVNGVLISEFPEREHLGSSYVPPPRRDRISKAGAVEYLRAGFTPKEIAEEFSGFSVPQLAAYYTHYVKWGKKLPGET